MEEPVKKNIHSEAVDRLFAAVLSLKNEEECYRFFEDICTVNELLSLAQRFEVGTRLMERQTYLEIAKATGASTATISRVSRLLGDNTSGIEMAAGRIGLTNLTPSQKGSENHDQ